MNNFLKKLGVLTLGISLVAGVGAVLAMPKSNSSIQTNAATPVAGTTYKLVTSEDELVVGANYTIASIKDGDGYVARTTEELNKRNALKITVSNYIFTSTKSVLNLELGGSSGAWTFLTTNYLGTNGYLNTTNSTSTNVLKVLADDDKYNKVTITIDATSYLATISFTGKSSKNKIRFHLAGASSFFSCYSSSDGQQPIYLYRAVTAKDWADDFLATTKDACSVPTQDNREAVEAVWNSTVTKYNQLTDDQKEILQEVTYEDENLGEAIKRYDTIIKKYASSSSIISNYINRTIPSNNKSLINSDTTTAITIVAVIMIVSVSAIGGYFFIKKTKHE